MLVTRPARIDVLLIGPDSGVAEALTATLTSNGAAITAAASSEAARNTLEQGHRPELIILDLEAGNGGDELIGFIKGHAELRHIPTVVLTTAGDHDSVNRAWDLLANCVIRKPSQPDQLGKVFRTLSTFWLDLVVLPRSGHARAAGGRVL